MNFEGYDDNGDVIEVDEQYFEKEKIRPMSESVKTATIETFGDVEYTVGNPYNPRACQDCG